MRTLRKLNNIKIDKKILEKLEKEKELLRNEIMKKFGIDEKDLEILVYWANECFMEDGNPNDIPFGDYISHSWAGYNGEKVEGEILVLRNGKICVIEFYNNVFQYSDNGTLEAPEYDYWDDQLKDGDIVLGHKWVSTHYNNDVIIDEKSEKIFYRKPYIYCEGVKNEINNLKSIKEVLGEWLK